MGNWPMTEEELEAYLAKVEANTRQEEEEARQVALAHKRFDDSWRNLSEEELCEMARVLDDDLKEKIRNIPDVSAIVLRAVAKSLFCDWRVKCRIARMDQTDRPTLEFLVTDVDGRVRKAVANSLNKHVPSLLHHFIDELH